MSGDRILKAEHHGTRTTLQAFDPVVGGINAARSVVDQLAFGAVGVAGFACPPVVAAVLFVAVTIGVRWYWKQAPRPDLLILGVVLITLHYILAYAARVAWPYDTVLHTWSRYNVFPWLGVALGVAGGLYRPAGAAGAAALTARETRLLRRALVALLLLNLPRGIIGTPPTEPEQAAVLRRVGEVDDRCRKEGISAEAARRILDPIPMPGDRGFDAWRLLRGSDHPRPFTDAEVSRLLKDE
jgi:hypothetical protein